MHCYQAFFAVLRAFVLSEGGGLQAAESVEHLPREEVIRRLRLLGQPATFFGEVRIPIVLVEQGLEVHLSLY